MKILNDATSPFGRKVVVAALERNIAMREEFVDLSRAETLDPVNPLRQIPVLVRDDGSAICDSMTILLFLDTQHRGAPLIPDAERWQVITRAALCDGLMEAVLQRVVERRRPENEQSPAFIAKLEQRIGRALGALDRELAQRGQHGEMLRADDIAAACALGYTDFRFSTEWRAAHPNAAAWYEAIRERPSLAVTAPTRTAPVPEGWR